MDSIIARINKLLALGERGGTEAEANAAMSKVHELLAKHNLSMDDVKDSPIAEEDYTQDESDAAARQPWQGIIWTAVAKLYFCKHLTKTGPKGTQHLVIGKPSNIAVVKYVAAYIVRTGEELARHAAADAESKQTFRNSFKKGFAFRVYARVEDEIRAAKTGKMTDSATGTALILSPLYDKSGREIDRFLVNHSMKVKRSTCSMSVSDRSGYAAGRAAGDSVSLRSNGVGGKATLAIGRR